MGMPVTVEALDALASEEMLDTVFAYFEYIDDKFSTYKEHSEISAINRGEIILEQASADMRTVFALAEQTKRETDGYFDIARDGSYDPSGIVKGWAIYNAAEILRQNGLENFYVDAGGDVQATGKNSRGQDWRVGIRNPFDLNEIVKVLSVSDCGVATSGTYIRGQHIYNPKRDAQPVTDIVSLTVLGPDIYEADRFATAAFAMGREGIRFIARLQGFEGYRRPCQCRVHFYLGAHSWTHPHAPAIASRCVVPRLGSGLGDGVQVHHRDQATTYFQSGGVCRCIDVSDDQPVRELVGRQRANASVCSRWRHFDRSQDPARRAGVKFPRRCVRDGPGL